MKYKINTNDPESEITLDPFAVSPKALVKYKGNRYNFTSGNEVFTISYIVFPPGSGAANNMARRYVNIIGEGLLEAAKYDPYNWYGTTNLNGILKVLSMYQNNFEDFVNSKFISDYDRQMYYEYKTESIEEEKNILKFVYMNIAIFLQENGMLDN